MNNLPILALVITLGLTASGTWILPAISLHYALVQESFLHETARTIIESNRTQQREIIPQLETLKIPSIKIREVDSTVRGDYLIYQINFEQTGLFIQETNPTKKLEIVTDLV